MNQQTHSATASLLPATVPPGFERRDIIWPGTGERISVLMPLPTGRWAD